MMLAAASWALGAGMIGLSSAYFFSKHHLVAFSALFYLGLIMCVRPLFLMTGLDVAMPENYFGNVNELMYTANTILACWILIFLASHRFFLGMFGAARWIPVAPARPNQNAVIIVALVLTIVGVITVGSFVVSAGSIARFMIEVKTEKALQGYYYVRQFNIVGALVAIYGMLAGSVVVNNGRRIRRIRREDALLFGSLIVVNCAFLYMWGYRNHIMNLLVVAGVGYHFYVRRLRLQEILIAGSLLFGGLHLLRVLREELRAEVVMAESIRVLERVSFIRGLSMSMHFGEYDAFLLALQDVGDRFDYRYGQDFWNGLISWIPREIMPGRESYHIGGWFRRVYEPTRANGWPITVLGSWWVNFGHLGLLFGATISGAVCAAFDRAYHDHRNHPWHVVAAPAVGFFMLDGGVNTGAPQSIFLLLIPFFIVAYAVRPRGQPSGAAARASSRAQQAIGPLGKSPPRIR